ncbi:HutD family protein [Paludibacterium sp. THUN1379]|uniref:HutD/Ves family protein n=1 Tax=Paludibacterium sp. THUN1379 TaxID=3112107 RepID=UPI0030CBB629
MTLRRFGPADFRRMPWKNGGGETLQLAIWPPEADLEDFDWRITSASVSSDGPFSTFVGIDRSLAVLAGGDLLLNITDPAGRLPQRVLLHPGEQLDQFAGEVPIVSQRRQGRLLTDFNVMTRRDRYRHQLQKLQLDGSLSLSETSWMVYLTDGCLCAGAPPQTIGQGELLWGQGPAILQGRAEGWLVRLIALSAGHP